MKDITPGPWPGASAGCRTGQRMTDVTSSLCAREAALASFCQVRKTGAAAKTNNGGMRVNSLGALRCEADP